MRFKELESNSELPKKSKKNWEPGISDVKNCTNGLMINILDYDQGLLPPR